MRKQGFATVLTSSKDGIVRGSGALVFLANAKENESILKDKAAGFYSFNKGTSPQDYPESLMGAVALLRQTYYDAIWYTSNTSVTQKVEYNITLDAFNKLQELPSIFEGGDKYNDIRGKNVGDEFKVKYIIKGGGNEYQRLHDIKNSLSKFIIPINYPEALDEMKKLAYIPCFKAPILSCMPIKLAGLYVNAFKAVFSESPYLIAFRRFFKKSDLFFKS